MSDFDDEWRREEIKNVFRERERADQAELNAQREKSKQGFAREQRQKEQEFITRRDLEKQVAEEKREGQKLVNQWDMLEVKRQQALQDREYSTAKDLEIQQEQTKREIQLKKMDVEAKARMLKAEQDYYPIQKDIDFLDETKRSNLRFKEYANMRAVDRDNARALENLNHDNRMAEIFVRLKASITEKVIDHKHRKDFETHRTDEQIRFARAMAEMKREFGDIYSDEEIIEMLKQGRAQWDSEFDEDN